MRQLFFLTALLCLPALQVVAQSQAQIDLALSLVNAERAERGLQELAADPALMTAAKAHAEDMLERDFYSHVSPDGETVQDRFLAAGGSRWRVVAENIAQCRGCQSPADMDRIRSFQNGWMQSTGHRENILKDGLDGFGFGLASGSGRVYAVQTFAGPGTPPGATQGSQSANDEQVRQAALQAVNAERATDLQPNEALNALAEALVRGAEFSGGELSLPSDPYSLLPTESGGWRQLAISAEACGGCGAHPARSDGAHFAQRLLPESGATMTHLGFALHADGTGRKVAVAVYGAR